MVNSKMEFLHLEVGRSKQTRSNQVLALVHFTFTAIGFASECPDLSCYLKVGTRNWVIGEQSKHSIDKYLSFPTWIVKNRGNGEPVNQKTQSAKCLC